MKEGLERLCHCLRDVDGMLGLVGVLGLLDNDFSDEEYAVYISMAEDLSGKIGEFLKHFAE